METKLISKNIKNCKLIYVRIISNLFMLNIKLIFSDFSRHENYTRIIYWKYDRSIVLITEFIEYHFSGILIISFIVQ